MLNALYEPVYCTVYTTCLYYAHAPRILLRARQVGSENIIIVTKSAAQRVTGWLPFAGTPPLAAACQTQMSAAIAHGGKPIFDNFYAAMRRKRDL